MFQCIVLQSVTPHYARPSLPMAVLAQSLGGPSETRGDLGQNEFTLWLSPQYFRPVTESGCSALLGGSSEVAAAAEDVKVV